MGMPVFEGYGNSEVLRLNAEHGILGLEKPYTETLQTEDRLWLLIADLNTTTALYDTIFAVRNGVLESIWDVSARGLYD